MGTLEEARMPSLRDKQLKASVKPKVEKKKKAKKAKK